MHTPSNKMLDAAHFAMVPRPDVPRSAFRVQHTHKTTFDHDLLTPIYVDEVLPGDTHKVRMTALARLSTPLFPIMDNMALESFFFFVPARLVWDNFTRFMGERSSPSDTTVFLKPYVTFEAADPPVELAPQTLADYFGITLNATSGTINVDALPFRAYQLIWNEFFRDADLQTPYTVATDDGPDDPVTDSYITVATRNKRPDYFTSARPWSNYPMNIQQVPGALTPLLLGQGMTIGALGGSAGAAAPVSGLGVPETGTFPFSGTTIRETGTRTVTYTPHMVAGDGTGGTTQLAVRGTSANFPDVKVFVSDLRTATLVQTLMERIGRGGSRYTELVRSIFGVVSPDARLQRPEYLGGGRTMVNINPVAQTSATGVEGTTTSLAELSAVGSVVAEHRFSGTFTEHGYIIGLVNIRSDITYQEGIRRMWFRRTQLDHYVPQLAGLGEQAILSKELFAVGSTDASGDDSVFGFQERWAEYKWQPSRTSGYFRSSVATPLDAWHLGQFFETRPGLNDSFVRANAPVERVLQVSQNEGASFLLDAFFDAVLVRPMPVYSIPGMGARL